MKSSSPISAFVFLMLVGIANAFGPTVPATTTTMRSVLRPTTSQLQVSSVESTEVTDAMKLDLPKNALPFREDAQKVEELLNVEVVIGRFAMLAAVVFFAVEVTTDTSIPDQVQQFATVAMLS
ncbi:expressed unknown protein [Seminavis robusta]|uniref:Uncharacterized protein n=1 Tax=Seminavis robusta TaxID=568900 RepID=A0A9N8I1A0_9STRA|nr:expressed unknown protein [Seminavis robusta]|eukprot:Sro3297_g346340.1 n/a (123) ;mRNA; f:4826-5194